MEKILYCIYDCLAKDIGNVMVYPSDEVAKREISVMLKSVDSGIVKDLKIVRIGKVCHSVNGEFMIGDSLEDLILVKDVCPCEELFNNDEC